jgi:hypothetical protein
LSAVALIHYTAGIPTPSLAQVALVLYFAPLDYILHLLGEADFQAPFLGGTSLVRLCFDMTNIFKNDYYMS